MRRLIDSSDWTGLPSSVRRASDDPDDWGYLLSEEEDEAMWRDELRERRRQRWRALAMLWGPEIRNTPRDRRKGWTVYDGYFRQRGEEWTFWRGIVASIAIIFNRTHNGDLHGFSAGLDVGYWDARSDAYGYSTMICNLHPRCRVAIFSDGESWM